MLNTSDISISQLEEVFATFNKVSSDLGSSYKELESRVAILNDELITTKSARLKELTAKEQLASKLSTLMYALPGGIITLDADGIVQDENPAAVQILGRSNLLKSWRQALQGSTINNLELKGEISLKNDKRISISSSAYGNDGETIILLTDVTENYHLNNLISRDKRLTALGEMSARLAHQVRTPLSSAILYLSHISSNKTLDSKTQGVIPKILNRLRQIEKLVDSMLSYIRGGIITTDKFSLNDLLIDVQSSTLLQINNVNAKLTLNCPKQQCIVNGNREALFNALSNLIENAIQASNSVPCISLTLSAQDESFNIAVQDNGKGIDESIREQVFDPFFSTRTAGTGLGLAVVSSAVKAHNGDVFIEDVETGGTIFHLLIPATKSSSDENISIWENTPQQFYKAVSKEKVHG